MKWKLKVEWKANAPTHARTPTRAYVNVYYFKHLLSFWLYYLLAFFCKSMDERKMKTVPSKSIVEH